MAPRGRPPKPPSMHLVEGTHRRDRHGSRTDVVEEVRTAKSKPIPKPPAWLSRKAKAEWRRVAPTLHGTGRLVEIDTATLAAYCQSYVRWREAEEFLEKNGTSYPLRDSSGRVKCLQAFPQVSIARNAMKAMRECAVEFGMTPVARARTGGGGAKDRDDEEREALRRIMRPRS